MEDNTIHSEPPRYDNGILAAAGFKRGDLVRVIGIEYYLPPLNITAFYPADERVPSNKGKYMATLANTYTYPCEMLRKV